MVDFNPLTGNYMTTLFNNQKTLFSHSYIYGFNIILRVDSDHSNSIKSTYLVVKYCVFCLARTEIFNIV